MRLVDILRSSESTEQFIKDLAKAFREKRWVKILSLAGVVFALFLNPLAVESGLKLLGYDKPNWYSYLNWLVILVSFFLGAFLATLLTKKRQEPESMSPAISIIKGLLPYTNTKDDVDWFAKLQRGNILRECMSFCLGADSPFAILSGESGSGKTSFLQAGLSPNLDRQGRRPVYVKFTHSPALDSIRQSLGGDIQKPVSEDLQSLLELLREATRNDERPVVLILDQFDQFFAHHKSKSSRKPFIQQMAEWYRQAPTSRVKILISIRSDFIDRLREFHKDMEYTLTAHNLLRLERFDPKEAANVISVIAREAKIELDEGFVRYITGRELADREEGTVSPVDIQILCWMISGQKSSEERAFNRKAFQKLGGVEGLLERFLNRQLDTRETPTRRKAAINVMLALTDQNVCATASSIGDLKEKLSKVISHHDVEEAVSWLATSEVRLITPVQEKDITLYELAHERIILPLRRLAFKETQGVQKAQKILDRRFNEWIGNNRSRRYLLTFREWRSIKRYWSFITSGTKKRQQAELVSRSGKRFVARALSFGVVLLLGFGGYVGYKWYEGRPEIQIYRAQERLVEILGGNKDMRVTGYAALLLAVLDSEKDQDLHQKLWQQIKRLDPAEQVHVLSALADAYIMLSKKDEALIVLDTAQPAAEKLTSSGQVDLWLRLAASYIKISKDNEALMLLDKTRQASEKTGSLSPVYQALVFPSLAEAYGALSKNDEAAKGLDKVQHLTEKLNPLEQATVLPSLAEAYIKLSKNAKALKLLDKARLAAEKRNPAGQVDLWLRLAVAYIKLSKNDEALKVLDKVRRAADRLDPSDQVRVLSSLAAAYIKLSKNDEALSVLDKAWQVAEKLDSMYQASLLPSFAEAYGEVSEYDEAAKGLDKVQQATEKLDFLYQVRVFPSLAETYIKLSKNDEALMVLDKAQRAADNLDPTDQADLWVRLAAAYIKLSKNDEAAKILAQAKQATNAKSSDAKSSLLVKIATLYAKLAMWGEAIGAAQATENIVDEISALTRILIIRKDATNGTKNMEALEESFRKI